MYKQCKLYKKESYDCRVTTEDPQEGGQLVRLSLLNRNAPEACIGNAGRPTGAADAHSYLVVFTYGELP